MSGGEHSHHTLQTSRALLWALLFNGFFLVVEAVAGFVTGSLVLLADVAHMATDVAALALAYGAARLAARAPTAARSFGLIRAEVLGAFINGLILVLICAAVFKEAGARLALGAQAHPSAGWPVLVVGAVGLAINLGSAWYLARGDRANLNVRGALIHMLADALGSLGAMVAAVFMLLGYPEADAIVSILIGGLVLWAAWGLVRDSSSVLLQFAPDKVDCEAVRKAISEVSGVRDIHELHVWSLDHKAAVASVHIVTAPGSELAPLRVEVDSVLRGRFGIIHTTIQQEHPSDPPCSAGVECAFFATPLEVS
jgi:cobalt-zinc-cadmium efflux system protein